MPALKIVPLEIGRLDADLVALLGIPGREEIPIPSWLVEHPDGVLLFDTGLHRELQHSTTRLRRLFPDNTPVFREGEELGARLEAAGYRPTDVRFVVFSHLHFDHCGGTVEVPDARVVVQESEWRAGFHPKLVEFGLYNPDDFDVGHDRQLIEGVHDVFGDGTVVCVPTPGHTRGHQSLRVELASGPVVLTGDCVYFARLLDEMALPPHGFDLAQQRASMRELARLRDEEGCRLLFGHDDAQFRSLPATGLI